MDPMNPLNSPSWIIEACWNKQKTIIAFVDKRVFNELTSTLCSTSIQNISSSNIELQSVDFPSTSLLPKSVTQFLFRMQDLAPIFHQFK